jgi:N-acylneuraminate cytidylyltransferase
VVRSIAVLPARGGSRRIPRKNVRPFCGRPMMAWAIEAALSSRLFDHVLVSTDDPEIHDVAIQWGAECPFERPPALADDHATTGDVMAHATARILDAGWQPDAVCCIYPTAPFLDSDDLRRGLEALTSGDWSFAVAATDFAAPIFRSFRQREDGGLEMFFPEHYGTRSQDLPRALHDAAQFYWGRPSAWLEKKRAFDRWSVPVLIPRWRVQDIDEPDDWVRAELMFSHLRGHRV